MIKVKTILYSWEVAVEGSGSKLFFCNYLSYLSPSTNKRVASPPSSTMVVGPLPSGQVKALIVQSQYSSKVSPFQANTGVPTLAIAAAALFILGICILEWIIKLNEYKKLIFKMWNYLVLSGKDIATAPSYITS